MQPTAGPRAGSELQRTIAGRLVVLSEPQVLWARSAHGGGGVQFFGDFEGLTGCPPGDFLSGRRALEELVDEVDRPHVAGRFDDEGHLAVWRLAGSGGGCWIRSQFLDVAEAGGAALRLGSLSDVTRAIVGQAHREQVISAFTEAAQRVANATGDGVGEAIEAGLGDLATAIGADSARVIRAQPDGTFANTHEWCAPGTPSIARRLQHLPGERVRRFVDAHGGEPFQLRIADLAAEFDPTLFEEAGVHRVAFSPMWDRADLVGLVDFDSLRDDLVWAVSDLDVLSRFARMVHFGISRAEAWRDARDHLAAAVVAREEAVAAAAAAEAANAAKSRFLSRVSHELRTPVAAVYMLAELAEGELPPSPARDHVRGILTASESQLSMIDDLLGAARDRSQPGVPAHLDVATVARGVLDSLGELARTGGVACQLDASGNTTLVASPVAVRDIVANLCSNAVKYNRPGGSVTVSVRGHGDGAGREVHVTVADTGPGIPDGGLGRMWDPFERLGAERGPVPGSGLGLAIVTAAAAEVGARISVDSGTAGTTFRVVLPTAAAGRTTVAGPPSAAVLLVDDNVPWRESTEQLLVRSGMSVRHAGSGAGALAAVAERVPGVVVLDRHLPDGLGEDFIGGLRQLVPRLPVVVVSADATGAARDCALAAGADAYLVKPVATGDLVAALRAVCGGAAGE